MNDDVQRWRTLRRLGLPSVDRLADQRAAEKRARRADKLRRDLERAEKGRNSR